MNASAIRTFATRLLVVAALLLVAAVEARADGAALLFDLLKKYHPDKDGVEFARYYYYHPKDGDVIYGKIAEQDYAFIAILAAAKAAKHQKILPNNQPFELGACLEPVTLFNAVFSKSGEYVNKYGQEEHVKGYLQAENDEAKAEAGKQLAEYIPYWQEIPSICDFTFHSDFQDEAHMRKTLAGSWRLIRGGVEDFSHGNVAGGVVKLTQSGVNGDTACMLADNAIGGGMIGKTPVLGSLARSVCSGFAGSIIKGINTVVGAVVNGVGEFIGDAACTAGIGACTGDKPIDGFFNSHYENLIVNYSTGLPDSEADAWVSNWYAQVLKQKCYRQTGKGDDRCRPVFNLLVVNAKQQAAKLREEPKLAYDTIYAPQLDELAIAPQALIPPMLALDAQCADNLLTKYPWPGLQQYDKHNKIFLDVCRSAHTRVDLTGTGRTFDQMVAARKTQLLQALDASACTVADSNNPLKRRCTSYPARMACVNAMGTASVDAATARATYCSFDSFAANDAVAKQVARSAPGCQASVLPVANAFFASCATYADQHKCFDSVQSVPGVESNLFAACRVDPAKANAKVVDGLLLRLNNDVVGIGKVVERKDGCHLSAGNVVCPNEQQFQRCRTLRRAERDVPAMVARCARQLNADTIAKGQKTTVPVPGGKLVRPPAPVKP
jgi:hypothetical protein